MFTGIIEAVGKVEDISKNGKNIIFTLSSPFTQELKIDQSMAHDGCCLTVEKIEGNRYQVTAIDETLVKTNLSNWSVGSHVNLERCLQMNGRLDGHMVQGHVDTTGEISAIEERDGSKFITVSYQETEVYTTVPQGSVTLNGISLTVAQSTTNRLSVAIIPYTWEHTNLKYLNIGDRVNLEFDILGKYVANFMKKHQNAI